MAVTDGVGQETTGPTHHRLPNGILIVERLTNLDKLPRRCPFVATPLKIEDGSGSPIRPLAFCEHLPPPDRSGSRRSRPVRSSDAA